ncbi:Cytochrome P450 monooxygenase lolP1 [Colletotrichum sp. SAR 10_70]|nr:Cytochrome P450 monooxygenase lolP1 [Colletotrichum sp. SAR 10_71]KAI8160207.1 Cytochrome P450 monooxygenase lolP1 [Colletotrichum sp. SAR 10_70]KAI8183752.1 Cytochrome P450 monooxygenase lolP1 [Colletotrichum sp. SAR 10_75]KAI8209099.1 Cytochrome P450 monooxygenase lolP1 [Colletotrichum sp. SAR 10_65]
MQLMTRGGKLSFMLKELSDKYGPLVRVGPNEVLFGDADTYRKISAVRSDFTKGPWYELAKVVPDQHSLFSMRDDEQRKELRAKLSEGYAGRDNGGFEPGVDKMVAQFVDLVESKYISSGIDYRPIEFSHKSQYFALDVIGQLAFGEALGFLANDEDLWGYVSTNDQVFPALALMLNIPHVGIMMQRWPFSKLLPFSSDEYGFGKLMHIAGSDSTATAIRMTMLCLLNTPASLNGLRQEIDAAIAQNRISSPITDIEARELPYLQAVIKEGIRMYPPSTGLNYKQVAKGGAELCGHYLPEGTQLGVNVQKLMRSKETFGIDADVFRPERWLEAAADEERLKEMGDVVELAFGYGRFQCLGKTIAYMELNKIFVELLRRFDFAVVKPQEPLNLYDAAFWVTTDFWLRITRRPDIGA